MLNEFHVMKISNLIDLVLVLIVFSCNTSGAYENQPPVFQDCISYLNKNYCLSFKIDSIYRKDTYAAAGGGLTKSYRFVSDLDTIVIEFYVWKYKNDEAGFPIAPTESYRNKLLMDYGCEIVDFEKITNFFEGSLIYCHNTNLEFLEYSGIKHFDFSEYAVGVVINSIGGNVNSSKRHRNMKEIIKSIKVNFEPE